MAMNFATDELIRGVFGEALSKYTSSLLCKVSVDYSLDFKELSEKYMDSSEGMSFFTTSQTHEVQRVEKVVRTKEPKEPKERKEKRMCADVTIKGDCCKFKALDGSDRCGIHQRKSEGVKPEKKPKEPKEVKEPKKAKEPVHNHGVDESSMDCDLCDTHGSILNPELTEERFEASVQSGEEIKNRLKSLLMAEETQEVEKPEEPQEVEKPKEPEEKKGGFVRPKVRKGKKGNGAGPSKPLVEEEPVKEQTTEVVRSKLQMILSNADNDEDDEDFDEEDTKSKLTKRLAMAFGQPEEELDLDQMDSPTSVDKLRETWADMTLEEEEE